MTVTTATVTVGTSHPNGDGVCATHLFRLVEHLSIRWVGHDLATANTTVAPVADPAEVADVLFTLVATEVLAPAGAVVRPPGSPGAVDHRGLAMFVAVSAGSSLVLSLDRFRQLEHTEVCIAEPTWRRHRTQWSDSWHTDDWSTTTDSGAET